ncbi:hypothetical protein M3Y96_00177600 [Aphelenchoides besseyi]|nr:hypothetical protein M3Y96_00177600 [Aphelenchoides besseyi]
MRWQMNSTIWISLSTTKIAVRRADTSLSAIFDFFKVYDTITWFNLIAVFIIFTLIGLLVRQVEWRLGFRPRIRGFEFSLYSTYIITSVVRAKNPWPFDAYDLPWLIREKRYTLYTTKRFDWFREKVQTSMESPFYDFRQAFLVNPIQIRRDEDEVLDEVVGGNGVVILQSHIPVEKQRLMMRKGHPFLQQFNYAIRSQSMIIQRTYRKYSEYRDPVGNFSVLTFSFLQCAVLLGYFELIETSFASPFYELREAMVNNKVEVLENYTMSFNAVEKERKIAVLQDDDYSSYLADITFCNFVYLDSPFPPMARINQSINNQRIMIERAYRKYVKYR